jgi:hypothetical protein
MADSAVENPLDKTLHDPVNDALNTADISITVR